MATDVDIKKLDYTTEKPDGGQLKAVMHILGRTPDNERVHVTNDEIPPYFHVPTDEVDDELLSDNKARDADDGYTSIYGHDLTRIRTRIPSDVPKLRKGYEHYEADILFPNRFLIDSGITDSITIPDKHATEEPTEIKLSEIETTSVDSDTRIFYCDIEVDDRNGFPDEGDAEEDIISIAVYDNYKDEYHIYYYHPESPDVTHDKAEVHIFSNEPDMMDAFCEYLTTEWPDMIAGWNFKDFDARYLLNRLDNISGMNSNDISPLGVAYDDGSYKGGKIRGIAVFDMLKAYKNLQYTELDSYRLENVAQDVLGYGKIQDDRRIYEQWEEDPQKLLDYNVQDVKLTVELEEKEDIIKFNEEKADFAGGRVAEVIDPSQAVDIYILHVVHNQGYVLPSAATVKAGDSFEGAQVFDPSSGIKQMVEVLDLASLYPMSMKTINAGPTTKDPDGDITAPNGVSFTTERESIISGIIDDLLEERQAKKDLRDEHAPDTPEYKKYDRQQGAVKVIMNTLYGVMGWDRFRLYDRDVGAAVTSVGRECIKFTESIVSDMGYEVIYGDTDSVMVELGSDISPPEAIDIGHKLEYEINNRYDHFADNELNVDEHFFEIEFEKLYRRFIQAGKKKRYAGHVIWKDGKQVDSMGITGFEFRRSDYSVVAKDLQKRVLDKIVRGGSFTEISNLIKDEVNKMRSRDYSWSEMGIPGSITKSFEDYDSKTLTVRGSEYANENLGEMIQPGDKPKGIYVGGIHDSDLPPIKANTPYVCWMNENTIDSAVPDRISVDWDKYIDVQVEGPLSRIFSATEWSWGGMMSGQQQGTMLDYGGSDDEDSMFDDVNISNDMNEPASEPEPPTIDDTYDDDIIDDDTPDTTFDEYSSAEEDDMFEEVSIDGDDVEDNETVEVDDTGSSSAILDDEPDDGSGQTGLGDW